MSEIVFVLGAGASVHAGAPVMSNFFERARDFLITGQLSDESKERFQRVFNAQAALQAVHSKAELDLNNIESILTTLEMARVLNTFPFEHMRDGNKTSVDELIDDVKHLIRLTLELSMPFKLRGDRERRYYPTSDYRSFAELVNDLDKNAQRHFGSSILTFNYDLGLDVALASFEIASQYYLQGTQVKYERVTRNVAVLKPHGSLNWHKSDGQIKCQPVHDIVSMAYISKTKNHLTFDSMFPDGGEPVIVPPSWNKAEYHQTLSSVWRQAAKELKEARYIYALGFSLPETDSFFRLFYALSSAGGEPLKEFVVYNPDQRVEDRFKSLLGTGAKNAFDFKALKFDEGIKDIRKRLGLPVKKKEPFIPESFVS